MKLYSYFRSSCSWRVRIALAHKGLPFDYAPVNLLNGDQNAPAYLEVNPWGAVPVLEDGALRLSQSMAILEYLEEMHPAPALLPKEPARRAKVREVSQLINSGVQPYQNLMVLKHLLSLDQDGNAFAARFIEKGMSAVEKLLERSAGRYSVGDELSFADVCLVPQMFGVRRFGVDENKFPTCLRVEKALKELPAFVKASPENQPDAK